MMGVGSGEWRLGMGNRGLGWPFTGCMSRCVNFKLIALQLHYFACLSMLALAFAILLGDGLTPFCAWSIFQTD